MTPKATARLRRWRRGSRAHKYVTTRPQDLVCERLPLHAELGYAGKGIEQFPPTGFFKLHQVDRDRAIRTFKEWYRRRFLRNEEWRIDKSRGGMKGGPLHRLVLEMHGLKGSRHPPDDVPFDPKLVDLAIERRVLYYFALLESIRRLGYDYSKGYVRCVESIYGDLEIVAGHHRVAAVRALGIPELVVQVSLEQDSTRGREIDSTPSGGNCMEPVEGSAADWDEERIKRWIASSDWYQRVPVREGIVTPGKFDSVERLNKLNLPTLAGKTVLDIGCNSGMYSFACERLGARRVVGIDLNEKRLQQARTLKEILGSQVEFRRLSLHEAAGLGRFDYVFCIAVLHETTDLIGALNVLKQVVSEELFLEIALWKPPVLRHWPLAKVEQNKRGWTLLPTLRLLEELLADTFDFQFLGPSVRYDLFRLTRRRTPGS